MNPSKPSIFRLRITSKLFLAILLCCAVIAVAMTVASMASFGRGFIGYLNEQEAQRIASLQPTLSKAYLEHGTWNFLRDNPRAWFSLLEPDSAPEQPDNGLPQPRRRVVEADLTGLNMRVSLLDAQRRLVIGNPLISSFAAFHPISVNGATVGWVALMPFQEVTTGAGKRFQQQQQQANWIIAAIGIALAAVAGWLLSRMILAPVKRLAAATHRLASGDYSTRVAPGAQDELGELAQDFNQLALTLDKNESLRRDFMSDVSHELRTPLAVLRGELEAIEDGVRPLSMAGVQSLKAEVATLGKLVDDLYALSLADAGALSYRMQPLNVVELLRVLLSAFEPRFSAREIRVSLTAGEQPECEGDADRLRQLFNNLLENSLRYTDAGGELRVTATVAGGQLQLDFSDSKPGVPDHQLALMFERFYRADPSRNRSTGGAGLGLAISRNIVEAHQGRITAQASPLGGICISVTLPLARRPASAAHEGGAA
ncbi:sensor histidine kinase efflux regulator BaeS [Duganella sp. FT80W]|uniref:histidine kinase n=1 Tax=Duganella guangzhouensis TaxID=2666084 RepID=A0A6I2L176_9BURK|nr:sensor histidine kinase efflux regulator BaeS [Duganella guangzhouensis]MRW91480.1 sensor histidine kinase efflux regulator BaeS [Duganella guangzhouensis]